LLHRVHLPDLVGLAAPRRRRGGRPARRGGGDATAAEEPLDGPLGGQGLSRQEGLQLDPDPAGPPAGALGAEPRGGPMPGPRAAGVLAAGRVIGAQCVAAALAQPPEQAPDGGIGQPQAAADLGGGKAIPGEAEKGGAKVGGQGARHDEPPKLEERVAIRLEPGILTTKPPVGISPPN
jgi:hypothetical protein